MSKSVSVIALCLFVTLDLSSSAADRFGGYLGGKCSTVDLSVNFAQQAPGAPVIYSTPIEQTPIVTNACSACGAALPASASTGASLAQRKAQQQLSEGRMRHVGGGYGGGDSGRRWLQHARARRRNPQLLLLGLSPTDRYWRGLQRQCVLRHRHLQVATTDFGASEI